MSWNWLRALVAGALDSIFNWGQTQAEKPHKIEAANTPPAKLAAWRERVRAFKQRKRQEEQNDANH